MELQYWFYMSDSDGQEYSFFGTRASAVAYAEERGYILTTGGTE